MIPAEIAKNPGRVRYICHVTGEMTRFIPKEIIDSKIP